MKYNSKVKNNIRSHIKNKTPIYVKFNKTVKINRNIRHHILQKNHCYTWNSIQQQSQKQYKTSYYKHTIDIRGIQNTSKVKTR